MRRFDPHFVLDAIPSNAYVECFQQSRDGGNAATQHAPASLFGTAAASVANADLIQASIDGGESAFVATPTGDDTGELAPNFTFYSGTSVDADQQISLPVGTAGKVIRILGPVNGCELIAIAAGDKVNTVVVGVTNEAALVAGTLYTLVYDGVDNWIMTGVDALGAVETPVVPNTRA